MFRTCLAAGLMALMVVVSGNLFGSDEKSEPILKGKGTLPANYSKLGLSDAQKKKVYETRSAFRAKIDALQKQINELRDQERTELVKLLTPAQKDRLREILTSQVPGEKEKKSDEKSAPEKK
jgi:hypothetical protein